jgi:hypothetical protein
MNEISALYEEMQMMAEMGSLLSKFTSVKKFL